MKAIMCDGCHCIVEEKDSYELRKRFGREVKFICQMCVDSLKVNLDDETNLREEDLK